MSTPPHSTSLPISIQAPLINDQDAKHNQNDVVLEQSLSILETVLRFFGFFQTSVFSTLLSWVAFISLAVALPVLRANFLHCLHCEMFEIQTFDLQVAVFQAICAAISLVCISHNLRKYGLRKLLFVDRHHGNVSQFRQQYMQRIKVFYRFLGSWFTVCLLLKIARELARLMIYVDNGSWWQSIVIFFVSLLSWTYTTLIFLLGTALFNLIGNLQVIHFENYGKLLEKDLDVSVYIEEHMRLTNYLSKISHRFRLFLLLEFLFVSVCQFITLLTTTENQRFVNWINAGDFAVMDIKRLNNMMSDHDIFVRQVVDSTELQTPFSASPYRSQLSSRSCTQAARARSASGSFSKMLRSVSVHVRAEKLEFNSQKVKSQNWTIFMGRREYMLRIRNRD